MNKIEPRSGQSALEELTDALRNLLDFDPHKAGKGRFVGSKGGSLGHKGWVSTATRPGGMGGEWVSLIKAKDIEK